MAESVTWEGLRELAEFRAEKGCAISLYVDLDPSVVPTAGDAVTRFNSLLSEAERSSGANNGLTHDQRVGLKADFERIQEYFESEFDREELTVSCSSLPASTTCGGRARSPSRCPTGSASAATSTSRRSSLVGRGEGAIVAVVGRERGGLYRLHAGRLEEIVDKTEEVPGKHDQGGWSQARYQRHIEKLVGEHLREVADSLGDRVRGMTCRKVVISPRRRRGPSLTRSSRRKRGRHRRLDERGGARQAPELLELASPILEAAR